MQGEPGMVQISVDPNNLPPLTEEEKAELDALEQLPDSEIDTSDIPPLSEDQLARMVRRSDLYKPRKVATSLRVDADVMAWLKSKGQGYQTRINFLLREAMLRELKPGQ